MKKTENRIKCAFCNATFQRCWRNKKGLPVHGYDALKEHVIREHEDEPAVQALIFGKENEDEGKE